MNDRMDRYRQLLPVDRLEPLGCTVIGIGAIGRQVSLQLAAMGVGGLQLIDHDTVEPANLGPQAYRTADLGLAKVDATAELCCAMQPGVRIDAVERRFGRSMDLHRVVFCCVDRIDTRAMIFSAVRDRVDCFIDGRMAAEVMRIISVTPEHAGRYERTLFAAEEAHRDGCTARSTVYCANIAAGWMVHQFTRWLRGWPVDFDLTLNLLAGELTVEDAAR